MRISMRLFRFPPVWHLHIRPNYTQNGFGNTNSSFEPTAYSILRQIEFIPNRERICYANAVSRIGMNK